MFTLISLGKMEVCSVGWQRRIAPAINSSGEKLNPTVTWLCLTSLALATLLFTFLIDSLFLRVFLLACPPLIDSGVIAPLCCCCMFSVNLFSLHVYPCRDVMAMNSRRYFHFSFAN